MYASAWYMGTNGYMDKYGGMVRERIGDRGGGLGKNWGFWKIIYPLKWALAFEMGPQSWIVGLARKIDPGTM